MAVGDRVIDGAAVAVVDDVTVRVEDGDRVTVTDEVSVAVTEALADDPPTTTTYSSVPVVAVVAEKYSPELNTVKYAGEEDDAPE